jgi:serine protease Do
MRDGKETTIDVTVGKMPAQELAAATPRGGAEPGSLDRLGLRVEPLTSELAQQFGYDGQRGIVISGVEPGSPAGLADLQAGDLIVEANRQPVASVNELKDALAKDKDMALLLIKRKDASLFVTLKLG